MRISILFCLALVCGPVFATELVIDENGIARFLQQKEEWAADDIIYQALRVTEKGPPARIYTAGTACGRGVCPTYLFEPTKSGRWHLLGQFSGAPAARTTLTKGYFDLEVSANVGAMPEEKVSETYKFNGKEYVAQP